MDIIVRNLDNVASYCIFHSIVALSLINKELYEKIWKPSFWKQLIIEVFKFDIAKVTMYKNNIYLYNMLQHYMSIDFHKQYYVQHKGEIILGLRNLETNGYFKEWALKYKYNICYTSNVGDRLIAIDIFMNMFTACYLDLEVTLNILCQTLDYAPFFTEACIFKYGLIHFNSKKCILSIELQQHLHYLFSIMRQKVKLFIEQLIEWGTTVKKEIVIEFITNFFHQQAYCKNILPRLFPHPRTKEDELLIIQLMK